MAEQEIAVETRKLMRTFGSVETVHAVDGVDITIRAGEYVAVVGPSGSGKSTLLNMLGALDSPSSGDVLISGKSLGAVRNLDRFRSKTIGFVFQMHNLIPTPVSYTHLTLPTNREV